ncbi:hypothetical protein EDC04DRAFT_2598177 [Pisolithus marmoratus]|nr:hypothetical protein EDC04DRAFT_2598177 [Pisolithus marmoratus]
MSSVTDTEAVISEFVDLIYPSFALAVTNTAFFASLFTLFVVLLAHSTKESRRRMVLRLNVLAVCLVLTMGALVGFGTRKFIVDQSDQMSATLNTAVGVFNIFLPLLTPQAILLKIFAFPFCIKCARVVVLILLVNEFARALTMTDNYDAFRSPNLIAEWTMQMADNMYSVSFFLYNLRVRTSSIKRANFIFPLMFNIVLLVTIVTEQLMTISGLILLLLLINSYITVMGVLCATVWCSRSEQVKIRNEPSLRRVGDASRKGGSDTVMVGKRAAT